MQTYATLETGLFNLTFGGFEYHGKKKGHDPALEKTRQTIWENLAVIYNGDGCDSTHNNGDNSGMITPWHWIYIHSQEHLKKKRQSPGPISVF